MKFKLAIVGKGLRRRSILTYSSSVAGDYHRHWSEEEEEEEEEGGEQIRMIMMSRWRRRWCPGLSVRVAGGIWWGWERGIWEGPFGGEEKRRAEKRRNGWCRDERESISAGEHRMKAGRGLTSFMAGSSGVSYGPSELPGF
jgi:hypothetical protein